MQSYNNFEHDDQIVKAFHSSNDGVNVQVRDIISGQNSGLTGAGQNQSCFATTTILNTDIPVSSYPPGYDQTKAMLVFCPNAVQQSLEMYLYSQLADHVGWYRWKPIQESKDLGETANYAAVSKVAQVIQIFASNQDLNQQNFSGNNTMVSVDRIPIDFNLITPATLTNSALSGAMSICTDAIWNKNTMVMEPNTVQQFNPKAKSTFTGGLCQTGISQERGLCCQFNLTTDPNFFNKTSAPINKRALFDLDLTFNEKVIFPNLLAPFQLSFSLQYTDLIGIEDNTATIYVFNNYIDANGQPVEYDIYPITAFFRVGEFQSYVTQTAQTIIPKGVVTRVAIIPKQGTSTVNSGHVQVTQLNDNSGDLMSQTIVSIADGIAQFSVFSIRGSCGYLSNPSPKSIALMGDLLRQPSQVDIDDWQAAKRLVELTCSALNCNYVFTQSQFAEMYAMMVNTSNRQHHYGILASESFGRLKMLGRQILPYLRRAGKAAYRVAEKRVPLMRELREEYRGASEQFPQLTLLSKAAEKSRQKQKQMSKERNLLEIIKLMEILGSFMESKDFLVGVEENPGPGKYTNMLKLVLDVSSKAKIDQGKLAVVARQAEISRTELVNTITKLQHELDQVLSASEQREIILKKSLEDMTKQTSLTQQELVNTQDKYVAMMGTYKTEVNKYQSTLGTQETEMQRILAINEDHVKSMDALRRQAETYQAQIAKYDENYPKFGHEDADQLRQTIKDQQVLIKELQSRSGGPLTPEINELQMILDTVSAEIKSISDYTSQTINQISALLLEVLEPRSDTDFEIAHSEVARALHSLEVLDETGLGDRLSFTPVLFNIAKVQGILNTIGGTYTPGQPGISAIADALRALQIDNRGVGFTSQGTNSSEDKLLDTTFGQMETPSQSQNQMKPGIDPSVPQKSADDSSTGGMISFKHTRAQRGQGGPKPNNQTLIDFSGMGGKEEDQQQDVYSALVGAMNRYKGLDDSFSQPGFTRQHEEEVNGDTPRPQDNQDVAEEGEVDQLDNEDEYEPEQTDKGAYIPYPEGGTVGQYTQFAQADVVMPESIFGSALPACYAVSRGCIGMFATVQARQGGISWLSLFQSNVLVPLPSVKLVLSSSEVTRLMGRSMARFNTGKTFSLKIANIFELEGKTLKHSSMCAVAQFVIATMWASGQTSDKVTIVSHDAVSGSSWMTTASAILMRKDLRYAYSGSGGYDPSSGVIKPHGEYKPQHDVPKVKYFLAAKKQDEIQFPPSAGLFQNGALLDVSYSEWFAQSAKQFIGQKAYYEALLSRQLYKIVLFRDSSDPDGDMDNLEKQTANVGGFGDVGLGILYFTAQQHLVSQAMNATRVAYVSDVDRAKAQATKLSTKVSSLGVKPKKQEDYDAKLLASIRAFILEVEKKIQAFPKMLLLESLDPPQVLTDSDDAWVYNKTFQEFAVGTGIKTPDYLKVAKTIAKLRVYDSPDPNGKFTGVESAYQGMTTRDKTSIEAIFEGLATKDFEKFKEGSQLKSGYKNKVSSELTSFQSAEALAVIATAVARIKQQLPTVFVTAKAPILNTVQRSTLFKVNDTFGLPLSLINSSFFSQLETPQAAPSKNPEFKGQVRGGYQNVALEIDE